MKIKQKLLFWAKNGGLLFLILSVVAVNLFVSWFGLYNFDLTLDRRYSLSPVSRQILSKLKDQVTIKVFLSSNIPGRFLPIKNYVLTMLWKMERVSGGKLRIQVLDPDKDPKLQQEAKNYNLPQAEFTVIENDQYQTKKGFFGLVMLFTDRTAVIPIFNQAGSFEYDFIRRLLKLTAKYEPKLYLTTGHQENFQTSQRFYRELNKEYNLVYFDPQTEKADLLDGRKAKAILIYNPQSEWTEKSLAQIKGWWQKGKNVIIFADPLSLDKKFRPHFNYSNLQPLLTLFKLKMTKNLILAPQGQPISFNLANSPLAVIRYYGLWFKIQASDINPMVAWKNDLVGTTFLWAGNLIPTGRSEKVTQLVKMKGINLVGCPCSIQPSDLRFDQNKEKSALISLLYAPANKGKVLVTADADFISDNALRRYPGNLAGALDNVDILAFDERLVRLRAKSMTSHLLRPLTNRQKQNYRWLILASAPAAVAFLALTIGVITKIKQRKLEIKSD